MPILPGGGGGGGGGSDATPSDWIELTDADMGAIQSADTRLASLTYDSAVGWTATYAAQSGTSLTGIQDAPYRAVSLVDLGIEDFSWDTYGLDLLIATTTTDMNPTSPYDTGFGACIALDDASDGQGILVITRNASNLDTGQMTRTASGVSNFDDDLIGHAGFLRAFRESDDDYNIYFKRSRWETGTFRGHAAQPGQNLNQTFFSADPEDYVLGLWVPITTTSTLAAHSAVCRVYYRFVRLRAEATATVIAALGPN
jgi:hypothetical protein